MNVTQSSASPRQPSRRDFLKIATSALLGATGLIAVAGFFRFLDFESEPSPPTEFDLGPAGNFPPDSRIVAPEVPALVMNTKAGFSALSLICTHLGCTIEETQTGFACPCHGSHYDSQGVVTRGPATRALRSLRVEVNAAGHLIVHTD